jgi:cation diffusion facilitator CzcD-associated flavoprotein CzcO
MVANYIPRYLIAEGAFEEIDVFEQQATVGGVWNYSDLASQEPADIPQVNPVQPLIKPSWRKGDDMEPVPIFPSPMYYQLETNIMKCLMQYSDTPFPEDWQLYPTRQQVLQYLDEYANDVKPLIKFKTQVVDIRLSNAKSKSDLWTVKWQDLATSTEASSCYDAVAICSGHYAVPHTPDITGIREWNEAYPGSISHSKNYDKPEMYHNKKVIIVGNGASGVNIASQIGEVAQVPLFISSRSASWLHSAANGREDVPEIAEFISPSKETRAVRFTDGQVERGIDTVLFCTGYLYSFPFLSSIHSQLISDGFSIQDLYQHIFCIDHPSLAFLAVPQRILVIPLSEAQAAVIARVWSGRLHLPARELMYEWWRDRKIQKDGKKLHVLNYPEDIDHHNALYDLATKANGAKGKMPGRWTEKTRWTRENFPHIQKAFMDLGDARHNIKTEEELGFSYTAWLASEESAHKQ